MSVMHLILLLLYASCFMSPNLMNRVLYRNGQGGIYKTGSPGVPHTQGAPFNERKGPELAPAMFNRNAFQLREMVQTGPLPPSS